MSCKKIIRADSVAITNGVARITIADDTLSTLSVNEIVEIGLFTPIATTVSCYRVVVTDGTDTRRIIIDNQNWRPCNLRCRSILVLENKTDPEVFVLKVIKGRTK